MVAQNRNACGYFLAEFRHVKSFQGKELPAQDKAVAQR
jgi:hypothetical protein